MSSLRLYLNDLLFFVEERVQDTASESNGSVTAAELEDVFHQPFARLTALDNLEIAEKPVSQARLAVEVLRSYLRDEPAAQTVADQEAGYRQAALESILAHWGVSHAELRSVAEATPQDKEEGSQTGDSETGEIIHSLAERLGVAPERIDELSIAVENPTEEKLKELFGFQSTHEDPFNIPDELPRLLNWQHEQLDATERERPTEHNPSIRHRAEQTQQQTLQAAVVAAEAYALPRLRDILIKVVEGRQHRDADRHDSDHHTAEPDTQLVNDLTLRLALDFGVSGQIRTTRLHQATETLQTIIEGLRTRWFTQQQRFSMLSESHPVADWEIKFGNDYQRSDLEEDWRWLARFETWRSAFQTLLYPDSSLLPTLLEESSPFHQPSHAFRTLVHNLRTVTQLAPHQARQMANGDSEAEDGDFGYLAMLRAELGGRLPDGLQPGEFIITEQLTEEDLQELQDAVRDYFEPFASAGGRWLHDAPNWLKEIFYFVPLLLGLHLQRSGHYVHALAWYRTIFAYDREAGTQKIFHGLVLEEGYALNVILEPTTWLRGWLNPHDIASERRHAYTRFTLQSIIGCLLDFADAEFTTSTTSSLARARSLYLTALELLDLPEMLPPEDERETGNPRLGIDPGVPVPENPTIKALRRHAKLSLEKLRSGHNIAGMQQPLRTDRAAGTAAAPFHRTVTVRPTIYRYRVLLERAQQLVAIAQQVEASFLASLEKAEAEAYGLLQARQDLELSEEQIELQDLRVDETDMGIELARLQQVRAAAEQNSYQAMIEAGLNKYEQEMMQQFARGRDAQRAAANMAYLSTTISQAQSFSSSGATAGAMVGSTAGSFAGPVGMIGGAVIGAGAGLALGYFTNRQNKNAIDASTSAQIASVNTGFQRRKQEWRRQAGLASKNIRIGGQQIVLARQQWQIALQERSIAQLQTEHAAVTLDFLANKFTNAELYEWMSGVLNRVYRFFLQQATAIALLAQNQLAFERQEKLPGFIQHDYWRPPDQGHTGSGSGNQESDRRGLTGSARLLQDIFKLDQFAFKTRERKLQLSQTFSLARLFPFEFEQFRQTGRLFFYTSMEFFDRGFPGHYLRLIKRVSVSVLALVPPSDGIRATLANSGISQVVVGPDVFRTIEVQRSPELISFTSPINATGIFELKPEGELLFPFEGQGVDTSWQLEMPRAANPFDYRTVADVLITIDYTAQYSAGYRRQVISHLNRSLEAERPFHFRQEFADQWYDLHNPDPAEDFITVRFETRREDFPPHVDDLQIEHLLLFFSRTDDAGFEVDVESLQFTSADGNTRKAGRIQTVDGIISTRSLIGSEWKALTGHPPLGEWELTLPNTSEVQEQFANEQIEDILFVITFKGITPEWPV
jgi:hypothetical protein